MFIKIKGDHIGYYNASVTWFYRDNLDYLKEVITRLYAREYGEEIPSYFHDIKTIKDLKNFVKTEMDTCEHPFGFKHIDGTFALYQCFG